MTPRSTGYRIVSTNRGDTLQRIALRELGDASQWPDIALMNGLHPPYLTDDPTQQGPEVWLTGAKIRVPAASPLAFADQTATEPFGSDVRLVNGALRAVNGNFDTVYNVDNFKQALVNKLKTEPGELLFHPKYGCDPRQYIGSGNSVTIAMVAGELIKRSMLADPRVSSVPTATATVSGDQLDISIKVVAVDDSTVEVTI